MLRPLYLRRVLAWLPLDDLHGSCCVAKGFRYAGMACLVLYLHSKEVVVRCRASQLCLATATDQNAMQDLVAVGLLTSLMAMLQEGRTTPVPTQRTSNAVDDADAGNKRLLRFAAAKALRCCYRFRPKRGNIETDPTETVPVGSRDDISDTADAELLEECLKLSGLSATVFANEQEEDAALLFGTPCFTIKHHTPALYAPSYPNILLSGIRGRPAVTVIERADTNRCLMYLGTFYLEGFCESEAIAHQLGHQLLFWYAKCVVSVLAASQCLIALTLPGGGSGGSSGSGGGNKEHKTLSETKAKDNNVSLTPKKKKILILGLGAGVLPAFVQKYFPDVCVDVCEINQGVVEGAVHGFGLQEHSVTVYVEDCLNFVKRLVANNEEYDAVVCDVYGDGIGMPRTLCK
jgi:hypothetical protein